VPDEYVEAAEATSGRATAAEMSRALVTIWLRMIASFLSLVSETVVNDLGAHHKERPPAAAVLMSRFAAPISRAKSQLGCWMRVCAQGL